MAIRKNIYGKNVFIMICENVDDSVKLLAELNKGKYTIKTGITSQGNYKIAVFLNEKFAGVEIPKVNTGIKLLLEGKVSQITTGYYKPDKSLFSHNPIKMISGSSN